jgi:hypothetical protein
MAATGKWLGKFVGKWFGTTDGATTGPNYVDAALVCSGSGTAQLTPIGGFVAHVYGLIQIARRRLRR